MSNSDPVSASVDPQPGPDSAEEMPRAIAWLRRCEEEYAHQSHHPGLVKEEKAERSAQATMCARIRLTLSDAESALLRAAETEKLLRETLTALSATVADEIAELRASLARAEQDAERLKKVLTKALILMRNYYGGAISRSDVDDFIEQYRDVARAGASPPTTEGKPE